MPWVYRRGYSRGYQPSWRRGYKRYGKRYARAAQQGKNETATGWPKKGYVPSKAKNSTGQEVKPIIHKHIRFADTTPQVISLTNITDYGLGWLGGHGSYSFSFDQVSNYSELVQVYDQYKISGVECIFQCTMPPIAGGPTDTLYGRVELLYCVDNDDAATTDWNILAQHSRTRSLNFGMDGMCKIFLRPMINVPVYRPPPAVTDAYMVRKPDWIDCAYPDVPHYGLKVIARMVYASDPTVEGFTPTVRATFRYFLEMRDQR